MKISVPIELTEDQRIAVGLLETGKMIPCSREEARSYVTEIAMRSINVASIIVVEQQKETSAMIRKSLKMEDERAK